MVSSSHRIPNWNFQPDPAGRQLIVLVLRWSVNVLCAVHVPVGFLNSLSWTFSEAIRGLLVFVLLCVDGRRKIPSTPGQTRIIFV